MCGAGRPLPLLWWAGPSGKGVAWLGLWGALLWCNFGAGGVAGCCVVVAAGVAVWFADRPAVWAWLFQHAGWAAVMLSTCTSLPCPGASLPC